MRGMHSDRTCRIHDLTIDCKKDSISVIGPGCNLSLRQSEKSEFEEDTAGIERTHGSQVSLKFLHTKRSEIQEGVGSFARLSLSRIAILYSEQRMVKLIVKAVVFLDVLHYPG